MLRPTILPRVGSLLKSSQRGLRTLPMLRHDFSAGVPGLFSGAGFEMAWTTYQSLMIDKLNSITAGTQQENMDAKTLAILSARDPNAAPTFNHASMAHNNHHFFNTLSPNPEPMSDHFKNELEASFGSIETLKKEMILSGISMFGPGFVWLVRSRGSPEKKYSLMCTYLAGSPYPGAHARKQEVDMNTQEAKTVTDAISRKFAPAKNTVGAHGALSEKKMAPGGVDVNPILCLNMWEHTYMLDYGVTQKALYGSNWWGSIDWSVVERNATSD